MISNQALFKKVLVALLLAPFLMLFWQALSAPLNLNGLSLFENALNTGVLLFCVAFFTLIMGISTGFLIGLCSFKGRKPLSILLLLPLAMPAYIIAFSYGELLDNLGIVQVFLRNLMGYKTRKEYYFPEIRSFWGAVMLFSFTLYPYVYIASRLAFERQASKLLEAGLILGATKRQVLRRIAFKLAMPASLSGLSFVLFEVLNDIGLVSYCAVPTLSTYSLTLWLERGNLAGASAIALMLIGFILVVLKFSPRTLSQKNTTQHFSPLYVLKGYSPFMIGCVPALIGFVVPFLFIAYLSLSSPLYHFITPLLYSIKIAALVCILALFFGYLFREQTTFLNRIATLGYALPGSVLALGLLGLYGKMNSEIFLGTSLGLILALSFRFTTLASMQFKVAQEQLSPYLSAAAATLGASPWRVIRKINLPLLAPASKASFCLIFIDCLKELPLTMLLRPVGGETLALTLFESAQRGAFETAASLAFILAVLGLFSLYILNNLK